MSFVSFYDKKQTCSFILGGPLFFGPPNAYLWRGPDPPTSPGESTRLHIFHVFKAIWNNLIAKIRRLLERIRPRHFFRSSLSNTGQVQKPSWLEAREVHSKLFAKTQINFMWRWVCSAFHVTTSLHNFVMLFYSKLHEKINCVDPHAIYFPVKV